MNLLVKDVPADLMRKIATEAAYEGRTRREWVLRTLEGALERLRSIDKVSIGGEEAER